MKYAIVDIGSNAIKYKIFNENLELDEYYRHPLRLGRDVFSKGYLEEKTIQNLLHLLLEYKNIFKKNKITNVNFIATSALRDTENAKEIIDLSAKSVSELCANLKAIFDIDIIILGGSIGMAQGYLELVKKNLKKEPKLFHVKVVKSSLGVKASKMGVLL